ncbi:aminoglycoside phosphotransferase family protein [Catellatospora sp. NPDC049609]|uniref:phosphotransferase family protein n=1 Tax=Catellatospora sp. NPDC049609 TaxID=3155505 RepID=UPI00343F5BEC
MLDTATGLVLADERHGAPRLPRLEFPGEHPPMDDRLTDAFRAATGVVARLLEPLDFTTAVLVLRSPDPAPPAGYGWHALDGVRRNSTAVAEWAMRSGDARLPWFTPGWFERADRYIDETLGRLGRSRVAPTRQIKLWSMSSVLRTETDTGAVYLKAVLPHLAHEPVVTRFLAAQGVGDFAQVIAHSPQDRWWIAQDFGGVDGWSLPETALTRALQQLCHLQLTMVTRTAELRTVGCPRLSLPQLAAIVPELLARDDIWQAGKAPRNRRRALAPQERERLRSLAPFLTECCERLDAVGLPETLVHRDFHPGNVVLRGEGVLVHDWSFATVSQPMFDLASWLLDLTEPVARGRVTAFIRAWAASTAPDVLWQAWRHAKPLAAVVEILKLVELSDVVGRDHDFNWLPMTYGWARRLLNAAADSTMQTWGWRQ